jgi:hypothetical protein
LVIGALSNRFSPCASYQLVNLCDPGQTDSDRDVLVVHPRKPSS